MAFAVQRQDAGGMAVVAVRGELDISTAPQLRAALIEAIEAHPGACIVADLEGLEFVDSAGLGILVGGRRRAQAGDGDLVLVSTGRNVGRILELTGLLQVFEVYASVSAASSRSSPSRITSSPNRNSES